ncbi:MAG: pyridoxamine 5'-phosphate oxidase family protein [Butyricicoccaceae bacterium]
MRRKDREQDEAFAREVMARAPYHTLALTAEDGTPYCIPISAVLEEDHLYFHCAQEGKKLDCIAKQPRVCVSAVSLAQPFPEEYTMYFASAVAFGTARVITEDEERIHALRLICERYAADNMEAFDGAIARSLHRTGIVRVDVDEITAKQKKKKG